MDQEERGRIWVDLLRNHENERFTLEELKFFRFILLKNKKIRSSPVREVRGGLG